MIVYILEMMITSPERVVTEPLGVYDTMEQANINLDLVRNSRPETLDISYNIIKFEVNEAPSILKIKEKAMQCIGYELLEMFHQGMLEQMVEADGTFSYVVTDRFKGALEKAITTFHDSADDSPF